MVSCLNDSSAVYQQSSYSTNAQVRLCGFLILNIVGNGFQACDEEDSRLTGACFKNPKEVFSG